MSYSKDKADGERVDAGVCIRAAADPVLVTRGESTIENQCSENLVDGERVKIKSGRDGYAYPIFVPVPDNKKSANIAHIDWLSFTVHPSTNEERDWRWLRTALQNIFNISGACWEGTNRKWSGYDHRVNLIYPVDRGESTSLGLVAYGGKSQRGTMHVSLNAQACARINDWQLVQDWGITVEATITRVDAAHDDLDGKTLTIATVRKWYEEGLFSANGRPPAAELIDDLNSGKGKTFYIGSRVNGKLARFYEKGKKEGDPESVWLRAEVEWHNKSRVIPWDILTRPGNYLAGAYPCLGYLSTEQEKIKTIKRAASINYAGMVKWLKSSAGKSVNVMLQVEGDAEKVLEQIRRDGSPKRLEPYVGMKDVLPGGQHEDSKP